MPFCSFAKDRIDAGFVTITNDFIVNYLNGCSEIQLKSYMMGLYLCENPLSRDNSIEYIASSLNKKEEEIKEAFSYCQELGLISIVSYEPFQIQYLTTKNKLYLKTYNKEKYSDFNIQLETLFEDRFISSPNTYVIFYDFIEKTNISPNVFLMIAKYCVKIKGTNVSPNYIISVASNWISEGIRTIEAVDMRISQYELYTEALRMIATQIGKTSPMTTEDKDLYLKWTNNWGFDLEAILAACKKSIKSMTKLDSILDECYKNNAIGKFEIEAYLKNKKKLTDNAIRVSQLLGVWYDNVSPIIEQYISPWLQKGFEIQGLELIATYCFKNSIRKFEQMDNIVNTLYKEGIVQVSSIDSYYAQIQKEDEFIKQILEATGSSRGVTLQDRDQYKIWTNSWNFSFDVILFAANENKGKPMSDIAKTLLFYKDNNLFTIENIKNMPKKNNASKKFNENDRTISSQNLESNLQSIQDLEELANKWSKQ